MKTLLEHIDDLDRMIEAGNTPTDKLRSQLAFIGREVAALEANYASLTEDHTKLAEEKSEAEKQLFDLKAHNKKATNDWLRQKAEETRRLHNDNLPHPDVA